MKIMKLLASCAMVGALTAVCASGAFAASAADVCSDYVADEGATTGSVTVTAGSLYTAAGDYTVLVYPAQVEVDGETVNLNEAAEISDAYIKQIDQNSTGSFTLKFDGLANGEYYVRLGGNEDGYVYDTFTVGEGEPEMVLIGDVDQSGKVLAADATEVYKYLSKLTSSAVYKGDNNWYAAAYCTGDTKILAADATAIFKYLSKIAVDNVNTEVEIGKYGEKPTE